MFVEREARPQGEVKVKLKFSAALREGIPSVDESRMCWLHPGYGEVKPAGCAIGTALYAAGHTYVTALTVGELAQKHFGLSGWQVSAISYLHSSGATRERVAETFEAAGF